MKKKSDMTNYNLLLDASKKIGLPVKKIVDTLNLLGDNNLENNQLVKETGISKNVLNQAKQDLKLLFKPTSPVTGLSKIGQELVKSLTDQQREEEIWQFLKDKKYASVKSIYESLEGLRPVSKRDLDQFTATVETSVKRGALLDFFADIRDKKLLFLGDDDLTSVSAALFNKPKSITVVDIDKDILHEIDIIVSKHDLAIDTVQYDARTTLPHHLQGVYDVVFTDPPYTSNGIKLFLSRAISALNTNNLAARVYVCYGTSDRSKERSLPIQEIISQQGMVIRWIFDKFNRYQEAESIGSSNLYICEISPRTKPIIKNEYHEPIYTNN